MATDIVDKKLILNHYSPILSLIMKRKFCNKGTCHYSGLRKLATIIWNIVSKDRSSINRINSITPIQTVLYITKRTAVKLILKLMKHELNLAQQSTHLLSKRRLNILSNNQYTIAITHQPKETHSDSFISHDSATL